MGPQEEGEAMSEWVSTNALLGVLIGLVFTIGYTLSKAIEKLQSTLDKVNLNLARMAYRQSHDNQEPPW